MMDKLTAFQFRSDVLRTIRQFFYDRHFCEVQTPILSADSVVDCYIEPIPVAHDSLPVNHHGTRTYFLQTSPEFAMKRLLSAGMEAIFQITPVFRSGDRGAFHNPEFSMLEWYRCGDDYQTGMNLLADLTQRLLNERPASRSYQDVFESKTGINPHTAAASELRQYARRREMIFPDSYQTESADAWLDLLFAELVLPELKNVIVFDYPASQAQLARIRPALPQEMDSWLVSERFELFLNGIEIANGYHELCDAAELRRRIAVNNQMRAAAGRLPLPADSRLLTAMEQGLPACSGTALGIDRLLMILTDAETIDDVIAFPIETA